MPGLPSGRPQVVSPIQAPVVWLASRVVPPALRTSGSEATRTTSFLGVKLLADAAGEGVDEGARLPRRAGVARGRDDGHVVVGIGLERGVQLGELGVVDAVLPADLARPG